MIPGLSIDRAGAVDRIARRQHLSQVQLVVQLTRAALVRGATQIDIRSQRTTLTLSDNGRPPSDNEIECLRAVYHGSDDEALTALAHIEANYGLALLTTCLTHPEVSWCATRGFRSTPTHFETAVDPVGDNGRLEVTRRRSSLRAERQELRFYCGTADATLTFNGKPIRSSAFAERPFPATLASRFEASTQGEAFVGVVADGTERRVRYFKNGVYFGVRQRHTANDVPLDCAYNDPHRDYAPNFSTSIQRASAFIQDMTPRVLADLAARATALNPRDRARLVRLLMRAAPRGWRGPVQDAPVFTSSAPGRLLSPNDLIALIGRHGFLPYARPSERAATAEHVALPVLHPLAARRLAKRLETKARLWRPGAAETAKTEPAAVPPEGRAALEAQLQRRGLRLELSEGTTGGPRRLRDAIVVGAGDTTWLRAALLAPSSPQAAAAAANILVEAADSTLRE